MSDIRMKDRYAYPQAGTWKRGDKVKGRYACGSCGREIVYDLSTSGSAWRHADTSRIRCDQGARL